VQEESKRNRSNSGNARARSKSSDGTWLTYPSDPYIHTDKNGVAWLMPPSTPGMYIDKKGVGWTRYDGPTRQLPGTSAQPQVQFRNPQGGPRKPRPNAVIMD
jgi:hypothetical protein